MEPSQNRNETAIWNRRETTMKPTRKPEHLHSPTPTDLDRHQRRVDYLQPHRVIVDRRIQQGGVRHARQRQRVRRHLPRKETPSETGTKSSQANPGPCQEGPVTEPSARTL